MLSQQIRDEIDALKKLCKHAGLVVPPHLDSPNVRFVTRMRCESILRRRLRERGGQCITVPISHTECMVVVPKPVSELKLNAMDVHRLAAGDYE